MIKEASFVRELLELDENHMDRFARLNLCEYLREHLMKFRIDINDCKFPELLYGTAPATATAISWKKHAMNSHQDMVSYLDSMGTGIEFEDGKDVLPLDIILYRDLMETIWSSERLLPWTFGYVPFDFYLVYLNEYFYRNTPANFNVHSAASRCLEAENKLSRTGVLPANLDALSNRITQQAHSMIESKLESPVAAAGFMCIAEEAELISELLEYKTKNSPENDVFITKVLDEDSFNFGNMVQKTAFDILTTYRGPCSDSIAASLLGMKKEANLLRVLLKLNQNRMDCFVSIKICKSLRQLLLQFLTDIHDSKFPELMTSVSGKESGKAD